MPTTYINFMVCIRQRFLRLAKRLPESSPRNSISRPMRGSSITISSLFENKVKGIYRANTPTKAFIKARKIKAWVWVSFPADTEKNLEMLADALEVLLPDFPVITDDAVAGHGCG